MAAGDQENVIFAEPTTWTGSIGVIIPHFDVSGPMALWGVREDSIASGPYKQLGSPFKRMTEDDRKILQGMVNDSFGRFKEIVTSGRRKFRDDPAALEAVATGQIFTANQALDNGLVDKIGFIEPAIERAAELAGVSTSDVRCVKYERPPNLMNSLIGAQSARSAGGEFDLSAILELATPRAYYLWTWLPAAVSNSR
jgi:protease-4